MSDLSPKAVEGRELVLTLAPAWVRKRPEHREADLRLLFVSGEREGATSIRAQTASGELLARIPVEGPLEWGELSLVADQARVDAEAEADAALERGELPVKIGADGPIPQIGEAVRPRLGPKGGGRRPPTPAARQIIDRLERALDDALMDQVVTAGLAGLAEEEALEYVERLRISLAKIANLRDLFEERLELALAAGWQDESAAG